jgi:uncharacterized protein
VIVRLEADDPLAVAVCAAIRSGDVDRLQGLLAETPQLAAARVRAGGGCRDERMLLHVATDWPGHYPNVVATVVALIAAGADINARFVGRHSETPLHWAASSDDVDALDALLDAGADIEAGGGVIGGGTPLADAVAFGQWNAARRLVERGASTTLWQAAALGLLDRVSDAFRRPEPPAQDDITNAFWCACHGGQRETAEYLLDRGADRDRIGHDDLTPLDAARRSGADDVVAWLPTVGARSRAALDREPPEEQTP